MPVRMVGAKRSLGYASLGIACALLVSALALLSNHRARPAPPLQIGLWYWHTPFLITPRESARLRAVGIELIFVRAGTFRIGDSGLRLTMPQDWRSPAPELAIHLDFNFGYDVVRRFAGLPNLSLANGIADSVILETARAKRAGIAVRGLQLDFDCPTRLLPKYAELLRLIRARIPIKPRPVFSITALPTWLSSADLPAVAREADFIVPQFYEPEVGRTLSEWKPVSRIAMVRRGMEVLGRVGVPFYAGIPAYGRALVYGDGGRLMGAFHDFGPRGALRRPGFRFERAFAAGPDGAPASGGGWTGEVALDISAPSPAPDSGGKRWHIVYDLPTPTLVARHMALVRAARPPNCLGAIVFRYPEAGESETLPTDSLLPAIGGAQAEPQLRVSVYAERAPWEIIESGRRESRAPSDLTLVVSDSGTAGSFSAPGAVMLDLHFDRTGITDVRPHGFDAVGTYFCGGGSAPPLRSSLLRANMLRCTLSHIAAGEAVRLGPIRLAADGPIRIRGEWRIRRDDGSAYVSGSIPDVPIARLEARE